MIGLGFVWFTWILGKIWCLVGLRAWNKNAIIAFYESMLL
jgi:hypothetical protein